MPAAGSRICAIPTPGVGTELAISIPAALYMSMPICASGSVASAFAINASDVADAVIADSPPSVPLGRRRVASAHILVGGFGIVVVLETVVIAVVVAAVVVPVVPLMVAIGAVIFVVVVSRA